MNVILQELENETNRRKMGYGRSYDVDPVLHAHRPYKVGEVVNLPKDNLKPARRGTVLDPTKSGILKEGDSIRLEVEGTFKNTSGITFTRDYDSRYGGHVVSTLDGNTILASFTKYATILKLEQPPVWRAGDVIDVTFPSGDQVYTYVCDGARFPGKTRNLSFEQVSTMWAHGDVEIVRKK